MPKKNISIYNVAIYIDILFANTYIFISVRWQMEFFFNGFYYWLYFVLLYCVFLFF